MCLDPEWACANRTVTDFRLLTAHEFDGKEWKFSYERHGLCLTEVKYKGFYGLEKNVIVSSTVRTIRTNDYARTFLNIHYTFDRDFVVDTINFFELGASAYFQIPNIVRGNNESLIEELNVPFLKIHDKLIDRNVLNGDAPFWFGFSKQKYRGDTDSGSRSWGKGWKGCAFRSFCAHVLFTRA